jgi:hypothetical protein
MNHPREEPVADDFLAHHHILDMTRPDHRLVDGMD